MIVQSRAPSTGQLDHGQHAEHPVEGDHVGGDQDEADETGDEAGVQGVTAEGGRDDLGLLLLELDRQGAVVERGGEVLGLRSVKVPEIWIWSGWKSGR